MYVHASIVNLWRKWKSMQMIRWRKTALQIRKYFASTTIKHGVTYPAEESWWRQTRACSVPAATCRSGGSAHASCRHPVRYSNKLPSLTSPTSRWREIKMLVPRQLSESISFLNAFRKSVETRWLICNRKPQQTHSFTEPRGRGLQANTLVKLCSG